jgi:hypothetical protein
MEQSVINYILGAGLACIGWFARTLWDATQKLKEDLKDVEVDMAANYVRKIELDNRLDKIENMLSRIWDSLDKKADKDND